MNNHVFRGYASGLLMGFVTVVGCASTGFPWRYYNAHLPNRTITEDDVGKNLGDTCYLEGQLLGKLGSGGWPDLSLEQCKPDPDISPIPGASPQPKPIKLKCMTLLVDEFYSLKSDNQKCHQDLQDCQNGPEPKP